VESGRVAPQHLNIFAQLGAFVRGVIFHLWVTNSAKMGFGSQLVSQHIVSLAEMSPWVRQY
jgi:hypothetical protein